MTATEPIEIKVTSKRGIGFFIRVGKNFLEGTEKNEAVDNIIVSGLGTAINCAVAVATVLEQDKLGKITMIETNYPSMENSGRGVPQIRIAVERVSK